MLPRSLLANRCLPHGCNAHCNLVAHCSNASCVNSHSGGAKGSHAYRKSPQGTNPRGQRADGKNPHRERAQAERSHGSGPQRHNPHRRIANGDNSLCYTLPAKKPVACQTDRHQRNPEHARLTVVGISFHIPRQVRNGLLQAFGVGAGFLFHPVLYQIVHTDLKQLRESDQLAELRHRCAALPLADGLPGDTQSICQLLLTQARFPAKLG